jgi:non-specific serine/threonine protein kinase
MLEAGQTASPRFSTIRLLADALQLDEADQRPLLQSSRPEPGDGPETSAHSPGLPPAFPPSLPAPLTSFVGREQVILEISAQLTSPNVRVLTLLGPGGIGKTRLAQEVARRLAPAFPDDVVCVFLESVADNDLVIPALAESLQMSPRLKNGRIESIAELIGNRSMLILLDNMEQVLGAAPALPGLLRQCPSLRLLVTSRVPLNISGEHRWPVSPLSLPQRANNSRPSDTTPSEAELLFEQRAKAVDPEFALDEERAGHVATICQRLDGLPLAIELAAGRLGEVSVAALAQETSLLEHLIDGPDDLPDRLRTMESSLDWGYRQLTRQEQQLFRRISVFRNGFELSSVVDLTNQCGEDPAPVSRMLTDLKHRSMLSIDTKEPSTRYRLLEVVREFGMHLLRASGEEMETEEAHARVFLALAESHERHAWIPVPGVHERLLAELPNVRAALLHFEQTGQREPMLRLAGALRWVWTSRIDIGEGARWIDRASAIDAGASPEAEARALLTLAQIRYLLDDETAALPLFERALAISVSAGDWFQAAFASSALGAVHVGLGSLDTAKRFGTQSLELTQRMTDRELASAVDTSTLGTLGRAEHGLGNLDLAEAHLTLAASQFEARGMAQGVARVSQALGTIAYEQSDFPLALRRYQRSMACAVESDDVRVVSLDLTLIAATLAALGEGRRGARLLGAAATLDEIVGAPVAYSEIDRTICGDAHERVASSLDTTCLERELSIGASLTFAEAVAEALEK